MADRSREADGFGAFFRRYTRTWVHAVATAALTGCGILTFVHRGFAVLAVAAYVLPPVVLYLSDSSIAAASPGDRAGTSPAGSDDRSASNGAGRRQSPEAATNASDPATSASEEPPTDDSASASDDAVSASDESEHFWSLASLPSDGHLFDVAATGDRAYAVGADGCVFAREVESDEDREGGSRADAHGGWTVVLDDGPGAASNALRGVDAAPGGGVWIAGDGGALGRIDPATDRHVDHSVPDGDTSAITDVAAASGDDGEVVLLADGSGRIRRGRWRDGDLSWDQQTTPGSGSSLTGIELRDDAVGFLCDSNQSVFRTRDGGRRFEQIGLDDADGTLTAVAVAGADGCAASADDGVVHRYDGTNWTPSSLDDGPLHALAIRHDHWLACGDGGVVFEHGEGGTDWQRLATPANGSLYGCALSASIAVAVGEDGAVVQRVP